MAARLLELSRAARAVFEEADRALDMSLSTLCVDADAEELGDTMNTQPALLATSIAYFEYLRERLRELGSRITPTLFAGHSLGQFSAAVAAEALPLKDGLHLVRERGRIMKDWARHRPGGLATVFGLDRDVLNEICESASEVEAVAVAAHNAPTQLVIAGDQGPLEEAMRLARERGATVLRLPISVPGHTPEMRDAANEMERILSSLRFRDPTVPLVSNISGGLLTTAEEVRQELGEQICAAVEWVRCMGSMVNHGVATFVEVGPGRALSNIAGRFGQNFRLLAVDGAKDYELAALGVPLEPQPIA